MPNNSYSRSFEDALLGVHKILPAINRKAINEIYNLDDSQITQESRDIIKKTLNIITGYIQEMDK